MTTSSGHRTGTDRDPNAWAVGLTGFAGAMMMVTGVFQVLQGIVALLDDTFYVRTSNYTFGFDVTAWGWIHLLMGIAVGLIGLGVIVGSKFARIAGIIVVALAMVENFMFTPYYPLWSLAIIALDAAVIWALAQDASPVNLP